MKNFTHLLLLLLTGLTFTGCYKSWHRVEGNYEVTTELDEVRLSGSGLMHAEDIVTGDLEISISGSGDIFFSGTAQNIHTTISGSGSVIHP